MNLERAMREFEAYLDGYDREDEKIKLKIVHTYGVVACSREIAERMGLPREERELAQLIALLHDIGRFEQLKRYDSFLPDTMDHAAYGVRILFEEGMIRRFLPEACKEEVIIRTAIAKHSDYRLEGVTDERTLLHARLIRDADKLDNCRVKLEESVEVLLGVSAAGAGKARISEAVWQSCLKEEPVYSPDRKTPMDFWVSYLAYFYDLSFPESLEIVLEQDYISRIIRRIPCENTDTAEKMEKLEKMLDSWAKNRIRTLKQ